MRPTCEPPQPTSQPSDRWAAAEVRPGCTVWNGIVEVAEGTAGRRHRLVMSSVGGESGDKESAGHAKAGWRRRGRSAVTIAVLVLFVGFAITGVLAWVTATVNDRNENRLLQEQVNEAGTVVAGVLPTLEIPIASGAAIAGVTGSRITPFTQYMAPYVGSGGPFAYVALCGIEGGAPAVLGSVGSPSEEATKKGAAQCDFLSEPHAPSSLG